MICFSCHSSRESNVKQSFVENQDNEMWNPIIILTQKEKKIVKAKSEKLYKNND